MPGISEFDIGKVQTDGKPTADQPEAFDAAPPPKDGNPNPRPNETAYYTNEGPVDPEQLRAVIAQVGLNTIVVRHGEVRPR